MNVSTLPRRPDVLSATVRPEPGDPETPSDVSVTAAQSRGREGACACAQAPFVAWQLCAE